MGGVTESAVFGLEFHDCHLISYPGVCDLFEKKKKKGDSVVTVGQNPPSRVWGSGEGHFSLGDTVMPGARLIQPLFLVNSHLNLPVAHEVDTALGPWQDLLCHQGKATMTVAASKGYGAGQECEVQYRGQGLAWGTQGHSGCRRQSPEMPLCLCQMFRLWLNAATGGYSCRKM